MQTGYPNTNTKLHIRHLPLPEFEEDCIQATSINLTDFKLTLTSVYCPPRHKILHDKFLNFFSTLGQKFIAAGDYNAKHTYWGSRLISPRGNQLYNTITANNFDVVSSGEPTYWPTDFNKLPDLIDFSVIKNIKRDQVLVSSSYDLTSDHSPSILILKGNSDAAAANCISYPNRNTNWLKYKMYVSSHLSQCIPLKNSSDNQKSWMLQQEMQPQSSGQLNVLLTIHRRI